MAERIIKHASFWYTTGDGVTHTAMRGDSVDIANEADLKRGERHGAFATDEDLADGSDFAKFVEARAAAVSPASVTVDPADVDARTSPAGSADPRIQSGMVDPVLVPSASTPPQGSVSKPAEGGDDGTGGPVLKDAGEPAPAGNAVRELWVAYAEKRGAPPEHTRPLNEGGMTRDELRANYGA